MKNQICIHCFVSGKVQGVFYRAFTKEKAETLGLTGWVRNVEDGRVELLACGKKEKVTQLYEWLKQGPERAVVEDVSYTERDWQDHSEFEIRY